jgi:hypothetical protein
MMTSGTEIILGLGLWLMAGGCGWMVKSGREVQVPDLTEVMKKIEWVIKLAPVYRGGVILTIIMLLTGCGWLIPATGWEIWTALAVVAGWSVLTGGWQPVKIFGYVLGGLAAARVSDGLFLCWLAVWVVAETVRAIYGDIPGIGLNPVAGVGAWLQRNNREIIKWKREAKTGFTEIMAKYGSGLKTETVEGGKLYDCPVCAGEMEEIRIILGNGKKIIMDRCPKCGSVRYDRRDQTLAAAAIMNIKSGNKNAEIKPACPRCREKMRTWKYPGVLPPGRWLGCDYCQGCFAVANS